MSSGGEQIDDFLNCRIGTMVGGLEATAWSMSSIGLVMEAAVGEGPAQPFVKEEEQESNLDAFGREAVGELTCLNSEAAASSGSEQIDDFLDCCIGTMIGRLESAIGSALRVGPVVEAAVGNGSAKALVKEEGYCPGSGAAVRVPGALRRVD